MPPLFKDIKTPYIDAQGLLPLLSRYKKPREKIRALVDKGDLVRLKNGLYLIAEKLDQEVVPFEQVANILYGPSYVSLEWALSFYGMIPERVHTVTSMSLGRSREYRTPIGAFHYAHLPLKAYPLGIATKKAVNTLGNFLMATPEKALLDLVFISCKGLSKEALATELLESKRMDRELLHGLDKDLVREMAIYYPSRAVMNVVDVLGYL